MGTRGLIEKTVLSGDEYVVVQDDMGMKRVKPALLQAPDKAVPEATEKVAGLMSAADKKKINGVAEGANKYVLPTASDDAKGGVMLGYAASGKKYALAVDGDGRGYVDVAWTDTVYTLPVATDKVRGGVMLGHKNTMLYEYPVEVDAEGRAYVSVPQRELSGLQKIEFEAYANDYAGIWCTSASDVTHLDFVMGDNIDAGNINDTFRWRFTSSNLLGTDTSPEKPRESDLHTIMELRPKGTKAGELTISDSTGTMKRVLTAADLAGVTEEVTAETVVAVVKKMLAALK